MKGKEPKLKVPMGKHPHSGPGQTSQKTKKPGVRKTKVKGK